MLKMFVFGLSYILISAPSVFANPKSSNVIYGEDNRKDVFESRDSVFVELSMATAAMINKNSLKSPRFGRVEISAQTLSDRGICKQERFSGQVTAASCSGFLVAPNILVTAGHCIRSSAECASHDWVFDYKVDHAEQSTVEVSSRSVYSCKKIIQRSLDTATKDDFAVIELDRSVTDRRPLSFRRYGKVPQGTPLVVIGHPTGLPTKIADGAKVRSHASRYFTANLDTYGGNSGSAVINVRTSEVEGILVRGETDYVYDRKLGCQVSYRCANDACRGEDVTYITNLSSLKKL